MRSPSSSFVLLPSFTFAWTVYKVRYYYVVINLLLGGTLFPPSTSPTTVRPAIMVLVPRVFINLLYPRYPLKFYFIIIILFE